MTKKTLKAQAEVKDKDWLNAKNQNSFVVFGEFTKECAIMVFR